MSATTHNLGDAGDLIVGADSIGRELGFRHRQVLHLARRGELPGSFRLGKRLCLSRSAYRAAIAAVFRPAA